MSRSPKAPEPSKAPQPAAAPSTWRKRLLAWGLTAAALVFVAYAVPLRDTCEEPSARVTGAAAVPAPDAKTAAKPARARVSRDADGCTLHRSAGDARLSAAECAALKCEPGLASTFAGARLGMLAALLALYFLGTVAWAARWRSLLVLAGVRVGVLETWRITLESQAGGILLPGGIGGDALRVGFVAGKGGNVATVIAAVLLDRVLGLVTLAGLAAAFGAAFGGGELGLLASVLGALPAAFVVGLLLLRWPLVAQAPFFVRGPLARLARPVLDYLGDPRAPGAILRGLVFSVVVSATQLAVIRGLVSAIGSTPTLERWVYVGTTMAFIIAVIPALPGGWGTSDAAFVVFFGKAGLVASAALAVSLLYRLFWYSSGAVGAVLYLLRQHGSAKIPVSLPLEPPEPPGTSRGS